MTVTTTLDREFFDGDGSNKNFPFNFRFFENSQIYVSIIDPLTGSVSVKIRDVDYTLSGALEPGGGQVTFVIAPPVGASNILIRRIIPALQPTSIRNQGKFFPEIHEDVFDRLTMLIQQALNAGINSMQLHESGLYWDAEGLRIANGADAINSSDFATKNNIDVAVSPLATKADLTAEENARIAGDQSLQDQLTGGAGVVASQFSTISWHDQVITNSVSIPANKNAWSFGPTMTIALGQVVTIGAGSFWTIANGATTGTGPLTPEIPNPLDLNV